MNDGDSDEELEFEAEGETEGDTTPFILDQESYPEIDEADARNGYIELNLKAEDLNGVFHA